jgi:hypothetical protein
MLSLQSILSRVEMRQGTNDYTVAWDGRRWQIPKAAVGPGLRGSSIRIEARLDGTLKARIGGQFVELTVCEKIEKTQAIESVRSARRHVPPPGQSQWMTTSVWRGRNSLRQRGIGSPFPVSPWESRGGFPLTPKASCAPARNAGPHRCCRLPPQEGCRPLVNPRRARGI